jgi:hypothetical protein
MFFVEATITEDAREVMTVGIVDGSFCSDCCLPATTLDHLSSKLFLILKFFFTEVTS